MLVVAPVLTLVATCTASTVTPGRTSPLESLTTPVIVPRPDCAQPVPGAINKATPKISASHDPLSYAACVPPAHNEGSFKDGMTCRPCAWRGDAGGWGQLDPRPRVAGWASIGSCRDGLMRTDNKIGSRAVNVKRKGPGGLAIVRAWWYRCMTITPGGPRDDKHPRLPVPDSVPSGAGRPVAWQPARPPAAEHRGADAFRRARGHLAGQPAGGVHGQELRRRHGRST